MTTIQNNPFRPSSFTERRDSLPGNATRPTYDTLVSEREALLTGLVTSRHKEARKNDLEFRAYQLRPRKIMSNVQQAAFVGATLHFGIYALAALPVVATTFTAKRRAAKSLSYYVWKQFTEHAKNKPQQQAIHGALKRHGIIDHDDTVLGKAGRNHWRTLHLPTDANGQLDSTDLNHRMDDVMADLKMSALWPDDQLTELRPDITKIVKQFASLTHDLDTFGEQWSDLNWSVKKQQIKGKLTNTKPDTLTASRVQRDEVKRRIVVGDDASDQAKLQREIDDAITRSRTYINAGPGYDELVDGNESLLRDLVIANHKESRDNEIAFRAYQLRTRKLASNVQQASFVAGTAYMGAYLLPVLRGVATTFTVKRWAAKSLSFHVWQNFTEFAKDKSEQKAIHNALKRHGIIHHENNPWGWVGRNHWRTLELPTDEEGVIDAAVLQERMGAVMEDLDMAGKWSPEQLEELRSGIVTILEYFGSLNADLREYGTDWGKANREVQKHWLGAKFSESERAKYIDAKQRRTELKHHIVVGDDTADDAKLAQELDAALSVR
jgi:hypothetical protein